MAENDTPVSRAYGAADALLDDLVGALFELATELGERPGSQENRVNHASSILSEGFGDTVAMALRTAALCEAARTLNFQAEAVQLLVEAWVDPTTVISDDEDE